MKTCRNCRHFVWGHPNSQLKDVCIDCYYRHDGSLSNWEPMKKTRADMIRTMSDEELVDTIRKARLGGFTHYMVVVAEGAAPADEVAAKIKEAKRV